MSDNSQKQNLSPAEIEANEQKIRAERIEKLRDQQARQAIADVHKERSEKVAEIREQQKERFDGKVQTALETRKLSHNSPQPAPAGMKPSPILDKASEDYHRRQLQAKLRVDDNAYVKSQEKLYDQRIDQILDKVESKTPRLASLSAAVPSDPALASRISPSVGPPPPSAPSPASPGGGTPLPSLGPSRPSGHPKNYSLLKEQARSSPEQSQERRLKWFGEAARDKTAEREHDTKAPAKPDGQEKRLQWFRDKHPTPKDKGHDIDR